MMAMEPYLAALSRLREALASAYARSPRFHLAALAFAAALAFCLGVVVGGPGKVVVRQVSPPVQAYRVQPAPSYGLRRALPDEPIVQAGPARMSPSPAVVSQDAAPVAARSPGDPARPGPVRLDQIIWPVRGEIGLSFGWVYSSTHRDWRFHRGVDIKAPEGTPVVAALAGVVASVERSDQEGLMVVIDHGDGLKTVYANCLVVGVSPQEAVKQGAEIARVGGTGIAEPAGGPHLHFAIVRDEEHLDPARYLK